MREPALDHRKLPRRTDGDGVRKADMLRPTPPVSRAARSQSLEVA